MGALLVLQVVAGAPGSRLIDLVVPPQALVQQDSSRAALRLHGNYYITKQVGWLLLQLFGFFFCRFLQVCCTSSCQHCCFITS